jgi:hypothetical protein
MTELFDYRRNMGGNAGKRTGGDHGAAGVLALRVTHAPALALLSLLNFAVAKRKLSAMRCLSRTLTGTPSPWALSNGFSLPDPV